MRVFVALDIPEDIRRSISDLRSRLEGHCPQARWVRAESMHLTLKFMGEVAPERIENIRAALAAVRSGSPVQMEFRGVGFFPNERHPRVCWVGISASPNLAGLAAEIERRLEQLGAPREQRPFRPHLTLARFRSEDGLPRLREAIGQLEHVELGSMTAEKLHLYESRLKPGGAEYTRLGTFAFVGDMH